MTPRGDADWDGGKMTKSIDRAAKQVSIVMIALVLLCGGAGFWAVREQTAALQAQGAAGDLQRNHMNADMMHDAIRGDVLAVLASANPASRLSLQESRPILPSISRR